MKKRLLPVLLALVLTVSLAVPAFADEVTSGRCGENAYWRYSPAERKLTVTGTGEVYLYDVYKYDPRNEQNLSPWRYYGHTDVETVVIGEGITSLVGELFVGCYYIKSFTLPSTLQKLDYHVFYAMGNQNLKITIPDGVTSLGDLTFEQSHVGRVRLGAGISEIPARTFHTSKISEINLEHVTAIGDGAFAGCQQLRHADLSHVQSIGIGAFQESSLETADLRSLKSLGGGAFRSSKLKTVIFGPELEAVPAEAFHFCVDLEKAYIIGTAADRDRLLANIDPEGNDWLLAIGIEPIPFADVMPDRWSAPAVNRLAEAGIINGFEDGTFRPEQPVTRAQFSKMLSLLLPDQEVPVKPCAFSDVKASAWYADFVMKLAERGIVNGVGNGLFRPEASITRQDMATMISRMIKIYGLELPEKNQPITFGDAGQIADYAAAAVSQMQRIGVINGFEDGSFRPQANASREQTAQMLSNLMQIMEQAVPAE